MWFAIELVACGDHQTARARSLWVPAVVSEMIDARLAVDISSLSQMCWWIGTRDLLL